MIRKRLVLLYSAALAQLPILVMGSTQVVVEPDVPRPAYLRPITDPTFASTVIRVSGDPGTPIVARDGQTLGTWGRHVRPIYSKQQAWNKDGTLLLLYNGKVGSPSYLLLDGNTYQPLRAMSRSFTITTAHVSTASSATVSATAGGGSRSAKLTIVP
jgi:hypothetical protein